MATLECNNTPTSFTNSAAQENGEALPEEKSLSIDYSEDLWLANSEDSSTGYGQHSSSGKSTTTTLQETASNQAASMHGSYQNSISSHSGETTAMETTPAAGDENFQGVSQHHWGEIGQNEGEEGATVLQPSATTFLNGSIEQNGMEFHNSSGDEKEFAQMVPAGTYVETGDAQDKTYTAMMPAAGMGVNGEELPSGFTTMLNAAGQQMVFYGSGEDVNVNPDSSHMMTQQTLTYAPSSTSNNNHMTAVDSQDGSTASGEDGAGEGNLYVAMETTDTNQQQQVVAVGGQAVGVVAGGVAGGVLLNNGQVVVEEGMKTDGQQVGYATSAVSGSHQTISTLPFLQNGGAFPAAAQQHFNQSNNNVVAAGVSVQQPTDASQAGDSTAGQAGSDYGNHSVNVAEEYEQEDENSNSREASYATQEAASFHDQSVEANGDTNSPAKSFVCETCQKSFATGRYLKYHRKNHCKRAGSYEGRSEQEEMADMEVKRFACNICQRPFRVLKCMRVHKKKKHGIMKDFTCPSCAVSYTSSQELTDHLCQPKTPPPPVPSAETTTNTIVEQQHQQHQQQQHPQQQQPIIRPPPPSAATFLSQRKKKKLRQVKPCCDICGKIFGDRISLDIHRVKHIEEEFYPCDMCPLDLHAEDSTHLAVHFRIKFFTDDNQHILDDQKAAAEAMQTPLPVAHLRHHHHHAPIRTPSMPNNNNNASSLVSPATPVYSNPSSIIATAAACTNIIDHSQDGVDGEGGFVDEAGNYTPHHPEYSTIKLEDGTTITHDPASSSTPQQDAGATGNFYTEYASSDAGTPSQGGGKTPQSSGTTPTTTTTTGDDGIPVTKTILRSKPHICNICNKSFTEAAKLEIHYQSNHVEDRPFQCEICDKSFFTKWKLQRHMLSHLEQKPHSCPACSKSFVERGKLEAHYRTHLGTKPYKCEYCPKAFTVKSQLTIHVRRIHSADQPFGCEICGKAFLWRSGLEKHMRKHTREKPYSCSFCGQKYSQKSNLISHLAKVHNHQYVEPEQEPESQQEQQQQLDEEQQQLEEGEEQQEEQQQQQQQPQGE